MNNEVLQVIIKDLLQNARDFPALVGGLSLAGVLSYTTDVATGHTLYRYGQGETVLFSGEGNREIAPAINGNSLRITLLDHQQGVSTFIEFMDRIAACGVRFFECTLTGRKRVAYYGLGGEYVEEIPPVKTA